MSVPCLGVLDALETLKGQGEYRPGPAAPAGRAPRRGRAGAGPGEAAPLLRVRSPNPKPEPGPLAGNRSGAGDRISKAQIDWLTRIVGLGGWGEGGCGEPDGSDGTNVPFLSPSPPPPARDCPEAARSDRHRPPDFSPAAGQKAPCVLGARKTGPYSLPEQCVVSSPYPTALPAQPAVRPGPRLLGCTGPTVAQAGEPGPRCLITRHPLSCVGLRPPYPFSRL